MDNYGYQIYCTIHLLEVLGQLDKELACDERYEMGRKVYYSFLQSDYAKIISRSEYDAIHDFIVYRYQWEKFEEVSA
tara:strand:+ start:129 stop:359 length:231 start_codon:yes stop_codon:yes gene_type:complete